LWLRDIEDDIICIFGEGQQPFTRLCSAAVEASRYMSFTVQY